MTRGRALLAATLVLGLLAPVGARAGSTEPALAITTVTASTNEGTVTLEESADGSRITGTWLGEVVDGSCGTEIHGNYQEGENAPPRAFIMRKARP